MSEAGFPAELREFVRLFNRGEFWESHEALEDAWRESRSSFYHGLILYASAFVHVDRQNAHGIRAQLTKALDALEGLPDAYLGLDVAGIRQEARAIRRKVTRREDDPPDRWSEELAPPRLELEPGRMRGDEAELGA